jgi:HTH-like domain
MIEGGRPLVSWKSRHEPHVSASSNRPYAVARVVAIWDLPRSSFYAARERQQNLREPRQRGPKVLSDAELLAAIRTVLDAAVFAGEGYRKVWARLRHKGVRTSKERVNRLMRENQLISPHRQLLPVTLIPTTASSSLISPTRCGAPMRPPPSRPPRAW